MKKIKFQKVSFSLARISVFIFFVWFGILKIIGFSPTSPVVDALKSLMSSWWNFIDIGIVLGIFELITGILILLNRKTEKKALSLLFLYVLINLLPLIMLPEFTWSTWFVPTLEGQIIIKNIFIVLLVIYTIVSFRKAKRQKKLC